MEDKILKIQTNLIEALKIGIPNPSVAEEIEDCFFIHSVKGKNLNIVIQNDFILMLFKLQYTQLLEDIIQNITETDFKANLYASGTEIEQVEEVDFSDTMKLINESNDLGISNLEKSLTFENFMVSDTNKFAWQYASKVVSDPGKYFNPLFISGDSGIGKTHLINAIGNQTLVNDGKKAVKYFTAQEFKSKIMDLFSKGGRSTEDWKERIMHGCDLLIIDDIQILAGNDSVINVFFEIFNTMKKRGGQIVITSDVSPEEMEDQKMFHERVVTRFRSGATASIDIPDLILKQSVLMNLWKKMGGDNYEVEITEKVILLICNHTKDIRSLMGSINKLLMGLTFEPEVDVIDVKFAEKYLGSVWANVKRNADKISLPMIARVVTEAYGYKPTDIKSKSKVRNIAECRKTFIYLARTLTTVNQSEIANYINRTHSTVINTLKDVKKNLSKDSNYKIYMDSLIEKVKK